MQSAAENEGANGGAVGSMLGAGIGLGAGLPIGQQIGQQVSIGQRSNGDDITVRLQKVKALYDQGLISKEQFEAKQQEMLTEL